MGNIERTSSLYLRPQATQDTRSNKQRLYCNKRFPLGTQAKPSTVAYELEISGHTGRSKVVTQISSLPKLPELCTVGVFRPAVRELERRRRETAALRQQWRALNSRRERRQQPDLHSTTDAVSGKIPVTVGSKQNDTTSTENLNATNTLGINMRLSLAVMSPCCVSPPSSTERSRTSFPLRGVIRCRAQARSPLPYHTAITRRPPRQSGCHFKALTHSFVETLPQLLEVPKLTRPQTAACTENEGLKKWMNEIVKVVPDRPEFVIQGSSDQQMKVSTLKYSYSINSPNPSSHFYRSWSKGKDKDFVINPEWTSERIVSPTALKLSLPRP